MLRKQLRAMPRVEHFAQRFREDVRRVSLFALPRAPFSLLALSRAPFSPLAPRSRSSGSPSCLLASCTRPGPRGVPLVALTRQAPVLVSVACASCALVLGSWSLRRCARILRAQMAFTARGVSLMASPRFAVLARRSTSGSLKCPDVTMCLVGALADLLPSS